MAGFNIFSSPAPVSPAVSKNPYGGAAGAANPFVRAKQNVNERLTPGSAGLPLGPTYNPSYPPLTPPSTLPYMQTGQHPAVFGDIAKQLNPLGNTVTEDQWIAANGGVNPNAIPGLTPPMTTLATGSPGKDPAYLAGGWPTFSELLAFAASGANPAAAAAEGVAAGGQPARVGGAARPPSITPKATTFKGSATGRDYNVGQKYQGTNGYVYTAQPDGSFKQTGKPAGGGAKAYEDRASSNNQGAGGYTSSGQSKTAPDGTSWAANW